MNIEENINSLNIGSLISYNYSFIDRLHKRINLFTGARLCFIDGTNASFMLMPSVEAGYEVIDNLIAGASLGTRIVFCEETEISIPLGVFVVILEETLPKSFEAELVEDIMSLVASTSSKVYGKRSAENRKKKQNETDKIN